MIILESRRGQTLLVDFDLHCHRHKSCASVTFLFRRKGFVCTSAVFVHSSTVALCFSAFLHPALRFPISPLHHSVHRNNPPSIPSASYRKQQSQWRPGRSGSAASRRWRYYPSAFVRDPFSRSHSLCTFLHTPLQSAVACSQLTRPSFPAPRPHPGRMELLCVHPLCLPVSSHTRPRLSR
jgi:hypothetical protein